MVTRHYQIRSCLPGRNTIGLVPASTELVGRFTTLSLVPFSKELSPLGQSISESMKLLRSWISNARA